MPTIMIPGKDKEEAQERANEEEKKMLEQQHADPDFLLCRHGKKDWSGMDPVCAFGQDGKFRENNWNCLLMSKVRALMGQCWFLSDYKNAPGHWWWDDDDSHGVLYVASEVDKKEVDSYLQGCYVLIDWYKSRGKTDSFRILQRDIIRAGIEADALELTRIYSAYLGELYLEDQEAEG